MKTFSLPDKLSAIILDIDRTLYDHDVYAEHQYELHYRKASDYWSVSEEEVRERVRAWREEYERSTGGKTQSMGNAMVALGIPMSTVIEWRNEAIRPGEYLKRDEQLARALGELAAEVRLIAVTNNPVAVGEGTLRVLGVRDLVGDIVGLDTTFKSKPHEAPFREALRRLELPAAEVISVGDRYDMDIAPALALGMGAIQVDGVTEVYPIPGLLREAGLLGSASPPLPFSTC